MNMDNSIHTHKFLELPPNGAPGWGEASKTRPCEGYLRLKPQPMFTGKASEAGCGVWFRGALLL